MWLIFTLKSYFPKSSQLHPLLTCSNLSHYFQNTKSFLWQCLVLSLSSLHFLNIDHCVHCFHSNILWIPSHRNNIWPVFTLIIYIIYSFCSHVSLTPYSLLSSWLFFLKEDGLLHDWTSDSSKAFSDLASDCVLFLLDRTLVGMICGVAFSLFTLFLFSIQNMGRKHSHE